ncbi:hypothetical protein D8B46_04815 [Candidatus Gracilibacteria bacterium]|nr:hypothetical protein [Candidatus Gracilibacteria bacterium]RKW22776.1 MAG: hypothetical protein D8B46_04815 [Candidatus Gracilibacteria bacterium]
MNTNNQIKKDSSDKRQQTETRYYSAKVNFILISLVFFGILYMMGAGIGKQYLGNIFSPVYILLILSLNLFIFFGTQKIFFEKKIISYIISAIFLALSIVFILPIIL